MRQNKPTQLVRRACATRSATMVAVNPTKRTPELVARVLALTADPERPLSLTAACGECGIGRSTWSGWEAEDPALVVARNVARAKGQAALERRALDPEIAGPAANVIRHRLGCLDVDAWGERTVEVQGGTTLTDLAKADAVQAT